MLFAVEQNEREPRREMIRNKTGNPDTRKARQTELFMEHVQSSWEFRRYRGLTGGESPARWAFGEMLVGLRLGT
eukprot:15436233-Alexandrium_andersonii.AAC.1